MVFFLKKIHKHQKQIEIPRNYKQTQKIDFEFDYQWLSEKI